MLKTSAFGLSLLILLFASGVGFEPAASNTRAASAPASFVAFDSAELAELELADADFGELAMSEARGELGSKGDDEFPWEYILMFAVIAGAMALTIAIY